MAKFRPIRGDKPLLIVVVILCMISLLVVYSSTVSMAYRKVGGDNMFYLIDQLKMLLFGLLAMFIVHWINPKFYLRLSKYLFYGCLILAVLTFIPYFSKTINGASRWFKVPFTDFAFLASDPLKVSLVMYLAVKLGSRQSYIADSPLVPSFFRWSRDPEGNFATLFNVTRPLIFPILISAAVVMPSNLSTAMIILLISFLVLILGRVRIKEVLRFGLTISAVVVTSVVIMNYFEVGRAQTWVARFESYVSPIVGIVSPENINHDEELQKTQANIAIASGGVIGKGAGNSTQRTNLPHPYSDFAYAFIIEEYGLLGGIVVLMLYVWIFYRVGVIMRQCHNSTYALTVAGLGLVIVVSAFVNMAVSVGIAPITGQVLPIISRGGTSIFFTMVSLGVILGISRESNEEGKALKAKRAAVEDKIDNTEIVPPVVAVDNREVVMPYDIVEEEVFDDDFEVREGEVEYEENKRETIYLDEDNS